MSEDLNPEKMREENQDGESLSGLYIKDFDDRWWTKLYTKLQKTTTLSMHTIPVDRWINDVIAFKKTNVNLLLTVLCAFTVTKQITLNIS